MAFAERKSAGARESIFAPRGGSRVDGPRGMQISVSADGKQYRQRIGAGPGMAAPEAGQAERGAAVWSPSAALTQMNAAGREMEYGWVVLAGGAALTGLSAWVNIFLAVPLAALTAAAFRRARAADAARQRFHLEYQLDADARERWTLLNHALAALTRTERIWQTTTRGQARGWKQDSGASSLVTRTSALLRRGLPAGLTSSVTPFCLHLGPQRWLFFPDRLYVRQNKGYEAVEYAHLRLKTGRTRFIEEEQVPRDAQVVGRPWQRTASRDRQGIPITQYGVLEIAAPSGPRATLHVSSVGAADQFAALFESFQRFRRSDGEMPHAPPPSTDCYRRLGLTTACTKAEATRQFRQLVLIHHPDRMSRTTPASAERANAEMQEIVLAYKDLKRLRGW